MAEKISKSQADELREIVCGPEVESLYEEALAGYRAAAGAVEILRDIQFPESDYKTAIMLNQRRSMFLAENSKSEAEEALRFIGRSVGLSEEEIDSNIESAQSAN